MDVSSVSSSIKVVPVQFDPTPLTQGTVDGWFSFITNEPIELKLKLYLLLKLRQACLIELERSVA